jgi:N-acetylglucosaminyl-diphospho-decaprenol L-rhamnosyltransferase
MQLPVSCGAVIVAHARVDLARDCVRSLRSWLSEEDVVVVVNLPGAVAKHDLEQLEQEATIVSPPKPQGYSANVDLGVRKLGDRHELLLLANDDVVFGNDSLQHLVDCLRESPHVGLAGARLVDADGNDSTSFSRFPTLVDLLESSAPLPGPVWRRRAARPRPWKAAPGERGFPIGAVLLVRREAFADVGGFDEDFFLNWEDADFCFRLLERGWTVVTCPTATVTHLQGSSIARDVNFSTFYAGLRLYWRKRLGPLRWTLLESLLVALFIAGVVYDAAAAMLRPCSARARLDATRQRWRTRVFLR